MYFIYYLVYQLRPFGLLVDSADLPLRMSSEEMDTKFNITERKVNLTNSTGWLIKERLV